LKQQSVGLLTTGKFGKECLTEFRQSAFDLEIEKCLPLSAGFKCPKYIIRARVCHAGHGDLNFCNTDL
jgi:hypothetical protein